MVQFWVALLLLGVLTVATRFANHQEVFVRGQVYFVDTDCYSRMTRVQKVMADPGIIVRHHDFENYPTGTDPHTTAPLDYLIALAAVCFGLFSAQSIDLAGAWIGPVLAVATGAFLLFWARRLQLRWWLAPALLFAVSPILVQGTSLGRPDHQALLLFCLALALGGEVALLSQKSVSWGVVAGGGWGMALWVSLYEPAILLAVVSLLKLVFFRTALFSRERRAGLAVFCALILAAFALEGWRVEMPSLEAREYLARWRNTIGELAAPGPFSPAYFRWLGFGVVLTPGLLWWSARRDRRALFLLLLCAVTFALTASQIRWGYYLGLCFVMSLPWQLEVFPKNWMRAVVCMVALWPILQDWDESLYPEKVRAEALARQRVDAAFLREAAQHLRSAETLPVLAPWWFSPALAYWTGQPMIAGSSHESLPGIIAAARFYLDDGETAAIDILRERKVRRIVVYEPSRIISTAQTLLGTKGAAAPLAEVLFKRPYSSPEGITLEYANEFFKIFAVDSGSLTP